MLQIDQSELAVRANLSCNVIVDFEMERRAPPANSLAAIKSAFEDAGIEFTGGGKVALRRFAKGDKVQFKQFEPHIEQRLNCNVVDDGEVGTDSGCRGPFAVCRSWQLSGLCSIQSHYRAGDAREAFPVGRGRAP